MTVMPVVDDADVSVSDFMKLLANGNEVGGFSTPSTMIVKRELAVGRGRALSE